MRRLPFVLLLGLMLVLAWLPHASAEEPAAVRAVLFYSPTCPHCHKVMDEVLPPLQAQYGDQLRIALINVTTESGQQLYLNAAAELPIPDNQRGVPAMVVGEELLIGDREIPARLPGIIEAGLAAGGIAWPKITGVAEVGAELDAKLAAASDQAVEPAPVGDTEQPASEATAATAALSDENAVALADEETALQTPGVMDLFRLDPVAAIVAASVFVLMIASILIVVISWIRTGLSSEAATGWRLWIIPALSALGIVVAGYLAFVETTDAAAVCGPVGDCNAVQQSSYARLFDVLPIGVLGIVSYLVIVGLWAWQRWGPAERSQKTAWVLPAIALIGVLFSVYLTALELFVIVAVCMWCITSAIIMTLILWFTYRWQIPPAVQPAARPRRKHRHAPR